MLGMSLASLRSQSNMLSDLLENGKPLGTGYSNCTFSKSQFLIGNIVETPQFWCCTKLV